MLIECGKYESQIDVIPNLAIYFHTHCWDKQLKSYWHFHISFQWIIYYFELTIGKED